MDRQLLLTAAPRSVALEDADNLDAGVAGDQRGVGRRAGTLALCLSLTVLPFQADEAREERRNSSPGMAGIDTRWSCGRMESF